MTQRKFTSGALEINLAQTRKANITIPENQRAFLALSSNHWGIHKRTAVFFEELNHPYTNHKLVVDEFRKILLGDRWFYEGQKDGQRYFLLLFDIAENLFGQPIGEDEAKLLLASCLMFFSEAEPGTVACEASLIGKLLEILRYLKENNPELLIKNAGQFKVHLGGVANDPVHGQAIFSLVMEVAEEGLKYWKKHTPTANWFSKRKHLFNKDINHIVNDLGDPFFEARLSEIQQISDWDEMCKRVMSYSDMADYFKQYIETFSGHVERFYYILFLLHLPGMESLRSQLLWELNKTLRNIRTEVRPESFADFLDNIFTLFEELKPAYMSTVLECLLTLGKEVIEVKDKKIISYFENKLIEMGFVGPGKVYIQENWQLKVNPNHLKNIRVWLELIMHAPYTFRKLLSALIVNLRLGGIFIFDTDLFQRDITKLLNSDISPLYKQIKQLTRIFPVYFNEIGAEGELRDVTTIMDEISGRQDKLIHFLRKQVHIEGNNSHIDLCRLIFHYWYDGHKDPLKLVLPETVASTLHLGSKWFTGVNKLLKDICQNRHCAPKDLLRLDEQTFSDYVDASKKGSLDDKKRLKLLFRLYALLREKYSFDLADIRTHLAKYHFFSHQEIDQLVNLIKEKKVDAGIHKILDFMQRLNEVIFNPAFSEGWESIYHKRHIAFGIPSMYGQYREDKFEALGLIFRLERLASNLMEEKIYATQSDYVTARSLKVSYDILWMFRRGLALDGVTSQGFDANLDMLRYGLTSESFSLAQFINLFQFMAKNVKDITHTYFFGFYDQPLRMIIPQIYDPDKKLDDKQNNQLVTKHSELFYRDILYTSFLIQLLDSYISRMIHTLQNMVDNFPPDVIRNIMAYDPQLAISPLYEKTPHMDSQIFLGSKAYFQKKIYLQGYPVPPGFVLSTEVFRRRQAIFANYLLSREMDNLIKHHVQRLEKMCGQSFGCPRNPLLLSVRSGTAISMPGAMNTFLNVGLNDRITEALSKQPNFGWTSWDCYRRLLQSWGMTYGINRDVFDQVMITFKEIYNVEQKVDFSPEQMREMAFAYKDVLKRENVFFEEDPYKQLSQAISCVLDSWDSERAAVYRNYLQIADEWGTAVVIQQMVLGNIDVNSGTGVVFTHNPQVPKPGIYLNGDFTLCSQGEDIVAGLVHALPVSVLQKNLTNRDNQQALEEFLPGIYKRLYEIAHALVEEQGFNHQEIEFTFQSPDPNDLYILQIRDQDTHKSERLKVFTSELSNMQLLGRGIGGGGGALNGRVAIDMEDILSLRKKHPEDPCILLRPDTVPDDIPIIFECDGLVAARGGTTSHAAVTAARLGKVCVLNCLPLLVNEKEKRCLINGEVLQPGDMISIDGFSGNIFKGHYKTDYTEIIR